MTVEMNPQKFPRIFVTALMGIGFPAVQKDMVSRMERISLAADGDGSLAGQDDEE